jgi:hypothetical protein
MDVTIMDTFERGERRLNGYTVQRFFWLRAEKAK